MKNACVVATIFQIFFPKSSTYQTQEYIYPEEIVSFSYIWFFDAAIMRLILNSGQRTSYYNYTTTKYTDTQV